MGVVPPLQLVPLLGWLERNRKPQETQNRGVIAAEDLEEVQKDGAMAVKTHHLAAFGYRQGL